MTYKTTAGKIILKSIFPEELRDDIEAAELDKGGLSDIMTRVAKEFPDQYSDILDKLNKFGSEVGSTYGEMSSLSLDSFRTPTAIKMQRDNLISDVNTVLEKDLPKHEKMQIIWDVLQDGRAALENSVITSLKGTPLEVQIVSGVRKGAGDITDIVAGEVTALDHRGDLLPYVISKGYSEGLSPFEFFLAGQRTRTGAVGVKLATPDAGDLSAQLTEAAMRLRVTQKEEPREYDVGIPVNPYDPDYEGSFISQNIEGIAKKGDQLTPDIVDRLRDRDIDRVMIYSPMTSMVEHGISSEAAGNALGVRLPIGSFVGIDAVAALTEPFVQGSIGSKHTGQRKVPAIDIFRQLISSPKHFAGKAAIAHKTGVVEAIDVLETGGTNIKVSGEDYYVEPGLSASVDKKQKVKKGDILSEGIPNPRELVEVLGLGGGRLRMSEVLYDRLQGMGIDHSKRITEYLAAGLLNHVRMQDEWEGYLPGDIVEYGEIARKWSPDAASTKVRPSQAKGQYLQTPVAYHTIGTRIGKEEVGELKSLGIEEITVSENPPPWVPEVRPARGALGHPAGGDWMLSMYGSNVKRSLLDHLFRGDAETDLENPVSYIGQMVMHGAPEEFEDRERYVNIPSTRMDELFA